MLDPGLLDQAVANVLEEFEARAQREEKLWSALTPDESLRRRDEVLLPVGRAAGRLMNLIIKASEARRILEVGSAYGYSTTWLAEAARAIGGRVVSLELHVAKTEYARHQLSRCGLAEWVDFKVGDALDTLPQLKGPFDFVFLDLWKDLYVPVFELLLAKLAPGAVIVADNMLYPEHLRAEARAYRQRVRAAPEMTSVLLAVGNGLEVSRYR